MLMPLAVPLLCCGLTQSSATPAHTAQPQRKAVSQSTSLHLLAWGLHTLSTTPDLTSVLTKQLRLVQLRPVQHRCMRCVVCRATSCRVSETQQPLQLHTVRACCAPAGCCLQTQLPSPSHHSHSMQCHSALWTGQHAQTAAQVDHPQHPLGSAGTVSTQSAQALLRNRKATMQVRLRSACLSYRGTALSAHAIDVV